MPRNFNKSLTSKYKISTSGQEEEPEVGGWGFLFTYYLQSPLKPLTQLRKNSFFPRLSSKRPHSNSKGKTPSDAEFYFFK